MATLPTVPRTRASVIAHLLALVLILFLVAVLGFRASLDASRAQIWLQVLVLMTAFTVVAGHGITGLWRGLLIDARYKMSLSRLQLLVWTLIVLSALFTAAITNIAVFRWETPLEIEIPSALWIVMGIATTSLVASPAILSTKRTRHPKKQVVKTAREDLRAQGYEAVEVPEDSAIPYNTTPSAARWADILKGEETGNAATLDLGKTQMFFFTFILALSYGAAVAQMFRMEGPITGLPEVPEGMNVLLGISHTGYLSHKTVTHTPEEPQPTAEGGGQ